MKKFMVIVVLGLLGAATMSAEAVVLGQADDFEDGTVMGWVEGAPTPNPPTNIADGGPLGLGDNWLENVSSGTSGSGSKMVMFNTAQWTGDYLAAGVDRLDVMMRADPSGAPLNMRVAIRGAAGDWYASTASFGLPNDGVWYPASFDLTAVAMTLVSGGATFDSVMSGVAEMRILSSTAPNYRGETIPATLGIDNLTAAPEPAALMLLAAGLPAVLRRRANR